MFVTPHITADTHTLLEQAPMTAHDYMLKAISDIDELLGKGYAKQHPELGLHADGGHPRGVRRRCCGVK